MTRQRFLAKQQCIENVIVVDALDVTRNRAVSLECACSAEIVYFSPISALQITYAYAKKHHKNYNRYYKNYPMKVGDRKDKGDGCRQHPNKR